MIRSINQKLALVCLLAGLAPAQAQNPETAEHSMPGMHDMPGMVMPDTQPEATLLMNAASGTSLNPESWRMPMLSRRFGEWNAMFMGTAFVVDTQQTGPRGGDKLYSSNWFMTSAGHKAGSRGALQFDLMLSLDPATIAGERYPLLFQTGETAYGKPLIDGQHPHNSIMAMGVRYAYRVAENTVADIYFAPVGDPALGPVAFPHRASAAELPQATLSHHLQDSTHVADEVATVGITHKWIRWEASGFHGAEPGENRWTIQAGAMDSWSTRVWLMPAKNWAAQVSMGRLAHPEALEAGDQVRATASLAYSKAWAAGIWSSSLIWGRTHNTTTQHNLNSYLGESVVPVARNNFITGRAELVDKDELGVPGSFRIGAYTAGYTRDVSLFRSLETGIGANVSFYAVPPVLHPYYGQHPVGANAFLSIRLRKS